MRRINQLLTLITFAIVLWLIGLNIDNVSPETHLAIVWAPAIAIVAFGIYLLLLLFVGVASFKTVPEESESLKQDIQRARKQLAKKGLVL